MTIFRIYYATRGAHVHCRVFAGEGENLMPCGKLVMRWHDFDVFQIYTPDSASTACKWFFFQESRDSESTTESIVARVMA